VGVDETHATRRRRLASLVNSARFGGSQTALAAAVGVTQSYVNRQLTGDRNIGEDLARRYEAELGLPSGWLDQQEQEQNEQHGERAEDMLPPMIRRVLERPTTPYAELIAARVAECDESVQLAVLNLIEPLMADRARGRPDDKKRR
jgi:plasmid maintenance system antidote protein VapI